MLHGVRARCTLLIIYLSACVALLTFAAPITSAANHKKHRSSLQNAVPQIASIAVMPARICLHGPYEEVHLLIDGKAPAGKLFDLTDKATFQVDNPELAHLDPQGVVWGKKDGATAITVTYQRRSTRVSVEVQGCAKAR